MFARLTLPFAAVLVASALLAASDPQQDPQTLADALKAVVDYPNAQYKALRAAGQTPNMTEILAQQVEMAKKYAARFPLDRVQGQDLELLASLLAEAGDLDGAHGAIRRRLAEPGLDDTARASTLAAGVKVSMTTIDERGLQAAETYAAQLDAVKGAPIAQKAVVHARLGGYYRGADVDDRIVLHMTKLLELAPRLPPADRRTLGFSLVNAYTSLAEVYGDREQAAQAIAVLRRGITELADIPQAAKSIPPVIERYSLVGKQAAPIEATNWLNAAPGTTSVDPAGRVTIVQFTAHWCGPCRKSYPAMLKLHDRFAKDGLQVIFSTQYYGFFESQRPLAPEAEREADQKYFVEHHGLPFKIAIEPQKQPGTPGEATSPARVWTEDRYFVSGIPQIVLVDKRGTVRLIVIGWDPANEARLTDLVGRLLAETTTGR
jgi:thiol-disulfide isomerase/thioredoxin